MRIHSNKSWLLHSLSTFLIALAVSANAQKTDSDSRFIRNVPPRKAIVVAKSETKPFEPWVVYTDIHMKTKSGRIRPGQTLNVTGWAPWLYYITADSATGFVSWKALSGSGLDSIRVLIEKLSPAEEVEMGYPSILPEPNAYLELRAVKSRVLPGECTTVKLSLQVSDSNRARIQFIDLALQLQEGYMKNLQTILGTWIVGSRLQEIVGDTTKNKGYTTYLLNESAFCSMSGVSSITIPPTKLELQRHGKRKAVDTVIFSSKPVVIKVSDGQRQRSTDELNRYVRHGQFQLRDEFTHPDPKINELLEYKVTLSGKGLLFPYQPPEINIPGVRVHDIMTDDWDTLKAGVLESRKIIRYKISFSKAGNFTFKGVVNFTFNDSNSKVVKTLLSNASVNVTGTGAESIPPLMTSVSNVIAVDVSQSMMIEDADLTRLELVKQGLDKFLDKRNQCDFGIILFAGLAWKYSEPAAGKCFSTKRIQFFGDDGRPGTAIGEAVFVAANQKRSSIPGKLIVISDGDNTTGCVTQATAVEIALKHNLTIYCIGIGKDGLVKFGNDFYGNPNYVTDTFRENTLKFLASKTKGKYYHASKPEDVTRFLNEILK